MKKHIVPLLSLVLMSSLYGSVDIYVQNNTPFKLGVKLEQLNESAIKALSDIPSSDLKKLGASVAQSDRQWRQKITSINPWSGRITPDKGPLLGFIGAKDMKDKEANYFKATLTPEGSSEALIVYLRVGPKEKPAGLSEARLWERFDFTNCQGSKQSSGWKEKGDQAILPIKLKGQCYNLFFKQKQRDDADNDIWINITPQAPQGERSPSNGIRVMSYNLYMLPFQDLSKDIARAASLFGISTGDLDKLNTGADQRAEKRRIPTYIAPLADVFAFQEGFDGPGRSKLIKNMKEAGVPYSTGVLGRDYSKSGRLANSGLVIMSRYPIVEHDGIYFQDKFNILPSIDVFDNDKMADKGVLYAKINKNGKFYHIFNTHTQAKTNRKKSPNGAEIRSQQLQRLRAFIDSKNIPATEPVIISGDMNIDKINPQTRADRFAEYQKMIPVLNATELTNPPGDITTWFDAEQEKMFKNIGQWIDYIMYSNTHLKPKKAYLKTYRMFSADPWDDKKYSYLSDHNPIVGVFEF